MLLAIKERSVIEFVTGTIVHQSKSDLLEVKPLIMGDINELFVDHKSRGLGIG
jgi:hypothetical protein